MSEREAAKSNQVLEGRILAVTVNGQPVALTRVSGAVQAFENKCPHLGLAFMRGKISDGAITCPWHGSRFDICSGRNLDWVNSFMGIKMPAWSHGIITMGKKPEGLKRFDASEKDGAVFVNL